VTAAGCPASAAAVLPRTAAPFAMPVEHGKVREFVIATRGDQARFAEGDHAVPPTFLACARLWQDPEQAAVAAGDMSRLLHAGQEYIFHGPPPKVGDHLVGRARITDEYTKVGGKGGELRFTEVTTDFHDQTGRLVATAVTTTVLTSKAPEVDR
jgi:hypothetical protein